MENYKEKLNNYDEYCNNQIQQYNKYLEEKLAVFKTETNADSKLKFDKKLEEVKEDTQRIIDVASESYNKEVNNIKNIKDNYLRNRKQKSIENTFRLAIEMAQSRIDTLIKNYS